MIITKHQIEITIKNLIRLHRAIKDEELNRRVFMEFFPSECSNEIYYAVIEELVMFNEITEIIYILGGIPFKLYLPGTVSISIKK